MLRRMLSWVRMVFSWFCSFGRERKALVLQVLVLRQQVLILQRKRPKPRLNLGDRVFWMTLSRIWDGWKHSLTLFQPKTVIGWQRKCFRLFWRWESGR